MLRFAGVGLLLVAVCALAGCGSGSDALYSLGGWGQSTSNDRVGQEVASTGIPLCTKGRTPVTITSIEPVTVGGQIRVDGIRIERWGAAKSAFYPGTPPGSRPAAGFVLPAPATCKWPPRYEAVVVAHRSGPYGGYVDGLVVHYRAGNARGAYTIDFTTALCGPQRDGSMPFHACSRG